MKRLLVATTLLAIALSISFAQGTANVTYVDHDKVATAIANGGALASGPDFAASMAKRSGPGQVEVHDKETDTFYILDGEATFVTGGTMVGGRVSRPNQQSTTKIAMKTPAFILIQLTPIPSLNHPGQAPGCTFLFRHQVF